MQHIYYKMTAHCNILSWQHVHINIIT